MSTKVVTGKVRFSFCNLWSPRPSDDGGTPKYSVTLLIPKTDTVTMGKIKAAIAEARDEFCKRNGSNALPAKPNHTLHDGDGTRANGEPFGPECKGCWVITASNKIQPVIVDAFRNLITDETEIYSGCYGRASLSFYGYSHKLGGKGVSAQLQGVQKLSDGDHLGGAVGSAEDFDDGFVVEEDDFLG